MVRTYSDVELDALKEFINISTAHAATALSKMVDKCIQVPVPRLRLVPVAEIPQQLGGADTMVVALYFGISGDMGGSMLILFPEETAQRLIALLTADFETVGMQEFKEVERSALKELGNVLTNSYLNALAELLNSRLLLSVPHYAEAELGAVIDTVLIELVQASDLALLMETTISIEGTNLEGHIIMFPDHDSLEKMLSKTGIS